MDIGPFVPFRPPDLDLSKIDFRNWMNAGAELYFEALQAYVKERESKLAADEVLEVWHHQTGRPIAVHTIGFIRGQVFNLVGRDANQQEVHVLAHVSSLQVEVRVTKRADQRETRKPMGFVREA